ncbi:MAG: hypothetical protein AAB658_12390, partial [Chloroflexota bacterium]
QVGFVAIFKHFSGFGFFCSRTLSTPAPAPVTQTVGPLVADEISSTVPRAQMPIARFCKPRYTPIK